MQGKNTRKVDYIYKGPIKNAVNNNKKKLKQKKESIFTMYINKKEVSDEGKKRWTHTTDTYEINKEGEKAEKVDM